MKKVIEHYIEFSIDDGTFFSQPIEERKSPKNILAGVLCYRFYDKLIVVSRSSKSVGKPENVSKWIHVKGR